MSGRGFGLLVADERGHVTTVFYGSPVWAALTTPGIEQYEHEGHTYMSAARAWARMEGITR